MRMPRENDFEFDYDRSYCEQIDNADHDYEEDLVTSFKRTNLKDDFKVQELDTDSARYKVRTLTNAFLDQCDAVQKKAMTSDKQALKNIDHVLGRDKPLPEAVNVPRVSHVYTNRRHVEALGQDEPLPTAHLKSHLTEPLKLDHEPLYSDTTNNLFRNYHRRYNRSPDRFSDTSSMIYQRDHHRSRTRFDSEEKEDSRSHCQKDAVRMKRSEMDERINGLLSFEFPSQSQYRNMKKQLGDMQEKMSKHRYLLDKYSGLDLNDNQTVDDRIQSKYNQIMQRMPDRETSSKERPYHRSEAETDLYLYSPKTTTGYSGMLIEPSGSQASELRGRLRRLICRSKKNPHYFRY